MTNYLYRHEFYLDFGSHPIAMSPTKMYEVLETFVETKGYSEGVEEIVFKYLVGVSNG